MSPATYKWQVWGRVLEFEAHALEIPSRPAGMLCTKRSTDRQRGFLPHRGQLAGARQARGQTCKEGDARRSSLDRDNGGGRAKA
eukprot:3601288-Pyramimonas_sp.AAC.1